MFKIEGTTIYLTRGDSAEFNINIVGADGNPYELQEGDLWSSQSKKMYILPRLLSTRQERTSS